MSLEHPIESVSNEKGFPISEARELYDLLKAMTGIAGRAYDDHGISLTHDEAAALALARSYAEGDRP